MTQPVTALVTDDLGNFTCFAPDGTYTFTPEDPEAAPIEIVQVIGEGVLTGPQGAPGPQGPAGAAASIGPQGFQGAQGFQGPAGIQGATGAGVQGATGSQGPSGGAQGAQGTQGVQGAQGFQGLTGAGTQGATGSQGSTGVTGAQGFQGATGSQGNTGFQGNQGGQGFQGHQGVQGSTGVTGNQGAQGQVGAQGFQGTQGNQGAFPPITILANDPLSSTITATGTVFTIGSLAIGTWLINATCNGNIQASGSSIVITATGASGITLAGVTKSQLAFTGTGTLTAAPMVLSFTATVTTAGLVTVACVIGGSNAVIDSAQYTGYTAIKVA